MRFLTGGNDEKGCLLGSVANDGNAFVWQIRADDDAIHSERVFSATGQAGVGADRVALCSVGGDAIAIAAILGGKALLWEEPWDDMGPPT